MSTKAEHTNEDELNFDHITKEKYIYAKDAITEIRKALYQFEQSTEKELFEDKEAFEKWVENDRPYFQAGGELAQQAIFLTPKADVQEVKHGKWKWDFADNGWADWTCSECGWKLNTDIHVKIGYKYCPNCGARM